MVNEGLRILEVLLEEGFELWPRDRSGALVAALVLSPSEADGATEEWGCKWGTIHPSGAWSFEMVLTLLTKVTAIHVRFFWIGLWGSSLKWLFLRLCLLLVSSLGWFYKCLHKFREKVLGGENKRWSKSLRRGRSLVATGIWSSCWALGASKLILLSSGIGRRIVTRAPLSTRFWSHCNGALIVILPNGLADLLGMELLEL